MSEDNYEETHGDTFTNQIGTGVHRVLYGITWLVQASLVGIMIPLIFLGIIMLFHARMEYLFQ